MTPDKEKTPVTAKNGKKPKKKAKLSPEEEELQKLHKDIKRNMRTIQQKTFDFRKYYRLKRAYKPSIDKKITQFQDELETYFSANPDPIFAYDIEEQNQKVICLCAIELYSDLTYKIHFKATKNIFRYYKSNTLLHSLIQGLFKDIKSKIVIAHGSNQKEQQYAAESNKSLKNTEEMTRKAMHAENTEFLLEGSGLQHFETKIGFERAACKFFKHDWIWFSNFNAMEWSFRNYLMNEPQRICSECGNPQDVLLYCLEDAIASLFIYCWYENHKNEIDPDLVEE